MSSNTIVWGQSEIRVIIYILTTATVMNVIGVGALGDRPNFSSGEYRC